MWPPAIPFLLSDDEGCARRAGRADLPVVRPEGGRSDQPGRVQEHDPARQGEAQVLRGGQRTASTAAADSGTDKFNVVLYYYIVHAIQIF